MTSDERSADQPDDRSGAAELDEFIARAVDRQIAEQQALREQLASLTDAVKALSDQGTGLDLDDLSHRMRTATRSAIDPVVSEMRGLRDSIGAASHLEDIRGSVKTLSADIEGIAQALIELNAGLREWAGGVDTNIATVRDGVERVRELAAKTQELQAEALAAYQSAQAEVDRPDLDPAHEEIDARIKETVELSLYLADQIEDFDRVLAAIGDLPTRLEGVVAQGIRRTLATRAKFDTEASNVIDEALASLDTHVGQMSDTIDRFAESEETLRKLGLGQAELASRIDSLYDAIDELARGQAPAATPKSKRGAGAKPARKPRAAAKTRSTKRAARKKPASSPDEPAAE